MTRIVASTPGQAVPGHPVPEPVAAPGHPVTPEHERPAGQDGVTVYHGTTEYDDIPEKYDDIPENDGATGAYGAPGTGESETTEESVDVLSPATLDLLPDPVVVTDATGTVEMFNLAASKVTGLAAGQAVGRHVTEVMPLLDERGNDWWECSRPSRELPRVTGQPERRLTYAGPVADHDFNVTARFTRVEGVLVRVAVCLRDTVSRERIERNRADLIATVAHELRSPLTSVKGFTATLLARWDRFTDEQKKLMLNTVNTDADRVTRLLTELLDVSRIDAGRVQIRKQIVDMRAAVRRVVEGKIAAGSAAADRFDVRMEGELPEMWVDPDKIDQVLHNLIDNALRHGAGTVTVVLSGTPTGAEVTVTDEGEGVPEANAIRVFAKFWRGASRGNGTGLGLYIAKALIESHGGTISVGRAPHGGAEFRFFLPAGGPVFG